MTTSSKSRTLPARPKGEERRASRFGWSSVPTVARYGILLAIIVGIWQAYVSLMNVPELTLPGPGAVAESFFAGWVSGSLAGATFTTLKILGVGMVFGTILASVLTVLATWTKVGDDLLTLLVSMLNPVPAIAILPLLILWFGTNPTSLVIVIVYSITWPIAINLSAGFRSVNPTILMVGQNLGLRGFRMVRDVLAPAALPHAITGLRTGWAFGWRTIVAAELIFGVAGDGGGLGFFINDAKHFLRIPEVFAGLITIAVIGILVEAVFDRIEKRTIVRWGMKTS